MSFRCEGGHVVKPSLRMRRVVMEVRRVEYSYKGHVTQGTEIVREAQLCEEHAELVGQVPPSIRTDLPLKRVDQF